jgi:DNA-binding NarL/FixJ family response regulator
MVNESEIHSTTWQSRVIVLEDHNETADCICKALREDGKSVKVAKDLAEFEKYLKTDTFDAGSVDWNINNVFVGPQALAQLKRYDPEAGRLVFSVHADEQQVERDAFSGGADFILEKVGDDYSEYLSKIEEAAQLGLSRRIARQLKNADRLPEELREVNSLRFPLDIEVEAKLYAGSRRLALEKAIADEGNGIIELVKHRGWWRRFNTKQFSEQPPAGQLGQLIEYMGAKPEDLARILRLENDGVLSFLKGNLESVLSDDDLSAHVDGLLSVLSYVLRLSNYEPEVMPYYWNVKDFFAGSLSSPPWDRFGLAEYLKTSGSDGITEAIFWIRSN